MRKRNKCLEEENRQVKKDGERKREDGIRRVPWSGLAEMVSKVATVADDDRLSENENDDDAYSSEAQ